MEFIIQVNYFIKHYQYRKEFDIIWFYGFDQRNILNKMDAECVINIKIYIYLKKFKIINEKLVKIFILL